MFTASTVTRKIMQAAPQHCNRTAYHLYSWFSFRLQIICENNMKIIFRDIEKAQDVDLASVEKSFRMHFERRPLEIQGWRRDSVELG